MKERSSFVGTMAMARLATALAATVGVAATGCGGPEEDPTLSGAGSPTAPGMPIGGGRGAGGTPTAGASAGASPAATAPTPMGTTAAPAGMPTAAAAPSTAPATTPAAPAATPAAPAAAAPPAARPGTIVPLYTVPSDPSWAGVIAAKRAAPEVPVLAVINPANGPGSAARSDYLAGVAELEAAGIKIVGYVSTGYTQRPMAEVQADVDRWRSLYPKVSGIFFDEMAYQPGHEEHYRRATAFAKGRGFDVTIGNPGVDSSPGYVGTVDVILIYESAGLPSIADLSGWHAAHDRKNFGVIPHAVPSLDPSFVQMAKNHVHYIYVQNDTLPNPWDTLPPYFPQLMQALR